MLSLHKQLDAAKTPTGKTAIQRQMDAAEPHEFGGLQVVDYYLWALQRMYETAEDRFFESLRPAYRLIMDLDDTTNKPYGEWYTDNNPLTLERMLPPAG